MPLDKNEFIAMKGYPGYYINMLGDIKGKRGWILKLVANTNGYCIVTLHLKGKQCNKYVHRLVAENFIENKRNLKQVNHKDGNKKNNCVSNLERCNESENQRHRYRVLGCKPSIHGEKKVKCCNIKGDVLQTYKSMSEASRCTGVDIAQISGCCLGKKGYKTAGGYKRYFLDLEVALSKRR